MNEIEGMYQDMLDEVYGEDHARLLKAGDPVAYNVGLNDFERESQ
jgi:hypothetical protein